MLSFIHKALWWELRMKLLASTILLLFGIAILYFYYFNIILLLIGIFCTLAGIYLCYIYIVNRHVNDSRLMQILLKDKKQIVWVYSIVTQRMPFGFQIWNAGTFYFKLIDGDEITLSIPAEQLKELSESLNMLLPHATFGYSRDKEQWYMANPELLLQHREE